MNFNLSSENGTENMIVSGEMGVVTEGEIGQIKLSKWNLGWRNVQRRLGLKNWANKIGAEKLVKWDWAEKMFEQDWAWKIGQTRLGRKTGEMKLGLDKINFSTFLPSFSPTGAYTWQSFSPPSALTLDKAFCWIQ